MEMTQFIGQKFNRLTCIGPFEVRNIKENNRNRNTDYIFCRCECGKEKYYRLKLIRSGATKSCGCYNTDRVTSHKMSKTRLYVTWVGMKSRCYNSNTIRYSRYGGRGITICEAWINSFESFKEWALNNGYTNKLTIERKNNDGNYNPENCIWVTMKQQGQNRNNSVKYLCFGQMLTVSAIAEKININRPSVNKKLSAGMTVEEIIKTHNKYNKQPGRAHCTQPKKTK
jgi:hypothetical protein